MCLENGKTFDLQKDTKLAYEVQKYKCMYDKAYKQHLFFLSRKMSFIQTKLSFISISLDVLEILIQAFKESVS